MPNKTKIVLLNYGIPSLAVLVILVHVFFVNTQNLNKWKGGGYGMYTGIHFYYHQIYSPTLSLDSLAEYNSQLKKAFRELKIRPNQKQLKETAKLILKETKKERVHLQIWKPIVNTKTRVYSRSLIDEIHLNQSDL